MENMNLNSDIKNFHDVVFDIEESIKLGKNKYIQIEQGVISTTNDSYSKASFEEIAQHITHLKNAAFQNLETFKFYTESIAHFRNIETLQQDTGFLSYFHFFSSKAETDLKNIHPEYLHQERFLKLSQEKELSDEDLYDLLTYSKIRSNYLNVIASFHKEVMVRGKQLGLTQAEVLGALVYSFDAYQMINAYLRGQKKIFAELVVSIQKKVENKSNWDSPDAEQIRKAKAAIGSFNEVVQYYEEETRLLSEVIDRAYSKLKPYVGTVYRGDLLSDEELKRMEGGEYFDPAFLSFSTEKETSQWFTLREPTNQDEKHPAFIEVMSKTGVNSSILSDRPTEKEVTFRKGQKFKVIGKGEIEVCHENRKKVVRHFVLEELF